MDVLYELSRTFVASSSLRDISVHNRLRENSLLFIIVYCYFIAWISIFSLGYERKKQVTMVGVMIRGGINEFVYTPNSQQTCDLFSASENRMVSTLKVATLPGPVIRILV